jgi:DNA-binding NtrC family response regulator
MLEDDRLIRVSLRRMLEGLGYEILVAENGAQALKVSSEFDGPIDLLLSDIVLPDSSGTEIASVLTRERPTLKVLFMSAYPSDLLVQQERVPPGTKTLEKPFDEEKLATAVRFALDEARQAAQGQPS